jgi:hypothetical protein
MAVMIAWLINIDLLYNRGSLISDAIAKLSKIRWGTSVCTDKPNLLGGYSGVSEN